MENGVKIVRIVHNVDFFEIHDFMVPAGDNLEFIRPPFF